jgi:hypothetical protein
VYSDACRTFVVLCTCELREDNDLNHQREKALLTQRVNYSPRKYSHYIHSYPCDIFHSQGVSLKIQMKDFFPPQKFHKIFLHNFETPPKKKKKLFQSLVCRLRQPSITTNGFFLNKFWCKETHLLPAQGGENRIRIGIGLIWKHFHPQKKILPSFLPSFLCHLIYSHVYTLIIAKLHSPHQTPTQTFHQYAELELFS